MNSTIRDPTLTRIETSSVQFQIDKGIRFQINRGELHGNTQVRQFLKVAKLEINNFYESIFICGRGREGGAGWSGLAPNKTLY